MSKTRRDRTHRGHDVTASLNPSSVDDLNLALRLYRRLLLRMLVIVLLGFAIACTLSSVNIYILGTSLAEWALLATLLLLAAEAYWEGWQIGRTLNDQTFRLLPVLMLPSGVGIIAQRATAMGMEWSAFLGPLRPVRRT